jgi:hypothetical protein
MPAHDTPPPTAEIPGFVDFRVDDLDSDERASDAFASAMAGTSVDAIAEHHSDDDTHSFYVLYDGSATWGIPGEPPIIALYLQRDRSRKTFCFERAALPLPSMAQSWLIRRGCPRDAIALRPDRGTRPADEATRALESRLIGDGDTYALGWSYTRDDPEDHVTLAVLRALDERAPSPFRVLVEEVDFQSWTHTLREGGFDTVDGAMKWAEDRLSGVARPLPPVRPPSSSRPAAVAQPPASRPPGRPRRG